MRPKKNQQMPCNPNVEFMFLPLIAVFVCCYVYYLLTKVPHESLSYRLKTNLGSSEPKQIVQIRLKTYPTLCIATCSQGQPRTSADGLCLTACNSSTSATRWYWSDNAQLVSIGHKCLIVSSSAKKKVVVGICSGDSAIKWVYHESLLAVQSNTRLHNRQRSINALCLTANEFGNGEEVNLLNCEEDHDALQSWAFVPDA